MVALLYTTSKGFYNANEKKDPPREAEEQFLALLRLYNELKKEKKQDLEKVAFTFVNLEEVDDDQLREKKIRYFQSTSGEKRFIKHTYSG